MQLSKCRGADGAPPIRNEPVFGRGYTIDKRNYTMTINDYEIVEPKYGSRGDVLMFHVTFTNKSDRPVSPWMAMLFLVDQETDVTA